MSPSEVLDLYDGDGSATGAFFIGALFDYWRLGTETVLSVLATGAPIPNGTSVSSDIGNNALTVGSGDGVNDLVITEGPYVIPTIEDTQGYNNEFVVSSLPASEFQYSWINASVSGSEGWMNNQPLRGYAPKDGKIVLIGGGSPIREIPAINFPTASMLYGE